MRGLKMCFVGTYPPTHCGLATFNASLLGATAPLGGDNAGAVIRVLEAPERDARPEVVSEWVWGDPASRQRSLEALAAFDVAVVQHEFGIYGGEDGEEIVDFLRDCPIPTIAVLHTALLAPSPHQRHVLDRVIDAADLVITPTDAARRRLFAVHDVDPEKVAVVPHGAAIEPVAHPTGWSLDPVVLTWGLIGPGKGLEHGIEAMSELADLDPAPVYVIAGQTHPKVLVREGERYRERLMKLAVDLGVADRVIFEDRYLDPDSLVRLLGRADIVLLPYDSTEQVCSGVLVEAVSAGKPVVATGFPHAIELLSSACGIVVPHEDPAAMARAVRRLITDERLAGSMREQARREADRLAWPAVGRAYRRLARELLERVEAA